MSAATDPLSLPSVRDLLDRMAETDALIERLYEAIGVPRPHASGRAAWVLRDTAPSSRSLLDAAMRYAAGALAGQISIAAVAFAATTLAVLVLTLLAH